MSDTPDLPRLFAALDATWPAARRIAQGPFTLREGQGGGQRVSAATLDGEGFAPADLAAAEHGMRALGQVPCFRVAEGQEALDAALEARGYGVSDPTVFYAAPVAAPVATLAEEPGPVSLFPIWPPLAITADIWTAGGVGPARQAVMARVPAPRTSLLARVSDRAAGAAFVACDGPVAMLHAIEVLPGLRRRGAARILVTGAAWWAQAQGAAWLALAVTRANAPARALHDRLGMVRCAGYHYRVAPG